MKSPILYVKKGCPYCRAATESLDQRKFEYETRDVRSSGAFMQELKDVSGQTKTPTLVINDAVLADFGVEELDEFLKANATAS